jgi:hypothetical protein
MATPEGGASGTTGNLGDVWFATSLRDWDGGERGMSAGDLAGAAGRVENGIGIKDRRFLARTVTYPYDGLSEVVEHAETWWRPPDGPFASVVVPWERA